tara:strand:+ start:3689 stop:3988 length:300 start_codon:yes stop_codon:yes gene_type:complete
MQVKIRQSTFDSLFKNVLSVNYCHNWKSKTIKDNCLNPLIVFKTKKIKKLLKICNEFVSNFNHLPLDDNYPLEVGAIKGFIIQCETKIKHEKKESNNVL